MSARIFISYSKQNPQPTQQLAAFLEAEGFSVWWDTNLTSGEVFRVVIDRELDAADVVIVVWTPQSVLSEWVIAEADHANRENKLIPLRADAVDPARIPKPYSTYHTDPIEDRAAILSAIRRVLAGSGRAAADTSRDDGFSAATDDRLAGVEKTGSKDAFEKLRGTTDASFGGRIEFADSYYNGSYSKSHRRDLIKVLNRCKRLGFTQEAVEDALESINNNYRAYPFTLTWKNGKLIVRKRPWFIRIPLWLLRR